MRAIVFLNGGVFHCIIRPKERIFLPLLKNLDKYEELDLPMSKYAIFFNKNYQVISLANEILIGLLFIIGSICFFFKDTMMAGTILFLIGSVLLLIKPVLKMLRAISFGKQTSNKD
jgi:hypothetical protein